MSAMFQMIKTKEIIELVSPQETEKDLYGFLKYRCLPDQFLYMDNKGALNWIKLNRSNKFNISTGLYKLLKNNIDKLAPDINEVKNLAAIGVGSGEKERLILNKTKKKGPVNYFPIDVSMELVKKAMDTAKNVNGNKIGIKSRIEEINKAAGYFKHPMILTFLGNSFSNHYPSFVLKKAKKILKKGDLFLIDAHLFNIKEDNIHKVIKRIENTYNTSENALFNMGPLLSRGMKKGFCDFNLKVIKVKVDGIESYRTQKYLQVNKPFEIKVNDKKLTFDQGEKIRLGFTLKYMPGQIEGILKKYGFNPLKIVYDNDADNVILLSRKENE